MVKRECLFLRDMNEIVNSTWRNSTIGIVLSTNSIGKFVAYIGIGKGHDELTDIEHILSYGSKLSFNEAKAFFPYNNLIEEEYYDR